MAVQSVLVCAEFSQSETGQTSCTSQAWTEAYVVTPEQQAQLDLLTTGGFDSDIFLQFFWGTIMLFIVGFSTGTIISQVRKIRRS